MPLLLKTYAVDGPPSIADLDQNAERTMTAVNALEQAWANGVNVSDIRTDGNNWLVDMSDGRTIPIPLPGGFNPRGPWQEGFTYLVRDLVFMAGSTYVSMMQHDAVEWEADLLAGKWQPFVSGLAQRVSVPVWEVGRENVEGELLVYGTVLVRVAADHVSDTYEGDVGDMLLTPLGSSSSGGGGGDGNASNAPAWTVDTDYVIGDVRRRLRDTQWDFYFCVVDHSSTDDDSFFTDRAKWVKVAVVDRNAKTLCATMRGTGSGGDLQAGDWEGVCIAVPFSHMKALQISFREEPGPSVSASGTIHARRTFNQDLTDYQVGTWSIDANTDYGSGNFFPGTVEGMGPSDLVYIEVTAASGIKALALAFETSEPVA